MARTIQQRETMMTAKAIAEPTSSREASIAPWWHTVLVIAVIAAACVASFYQHGLPNAHLPGLKDRLSSYVTAFVGEWLTVLLIAWGLRYRGLSLRDLVSGAWPNPRAVLKDLGLAIGFTIVVAPSLGLLLDYLSPATGTALAHVEPQDFVELAFWLPLSATAGFCEELAFRGYLTRQFSAWTGSRTAGILLQAIVFGVGHSYYNPVTIIGIVLLALLLGLFAAWRKSLRPVMLTHGLMDMLSGVATFLS